MENELTAYLNQGWELVASLNHDKYLVRKQISLKTWNWIVSSMKIKDENCKGSNLEDFKHQPWKIFPSFTEDFQVNYALNPEVDGHLVVQPTWHAKSISDLCEEQAKVLGMLTRNYCFALQEALNPDKIYVYSFNEDPDYHLHIHLKPRSRSVPRRCQGMDIHSLGR